MRAIPVAVPFAWTNGSIFHLQWPRFGCETGCDCLRLLRFIR
jgi:hypothetical protein